MLKNHLKKRVLCLAVMAVTAVSALYSYGLTGVSAQEQTSSTNSEGANKGVQQIGDSQILFHWDHLNWIFNDKAKENEFNSNQYWKGAMPAGFKQDSQGDYFLSVPRWHEGIPSTLNKIVMKDGVPLLEAYPSWDMNKEGDPNALQSVLGYEIDEKGYMWILDQGHVNGKESIDGAQKLVCWDIKNNKLVGSYPIKNNVASYKASFLNDVVVDNENGYVYIADSGIFTQPLQGSIIVFNMKTKEFKRVLFQHYSVQDVPDYWFQIAGRNVNLDSPMRTGADGIALSADKKTLYYCPLTGTHLYSVNTALLRNYNTTQETIAAAVKDNGSKGTNTDGMTSDNKGNIYYTMLSGQGVGKYDPSTQKFSTVASDNRMIWVDGMQILDDGSMIFINNQLHKLGDKDFNWNNPNNFVIWKTKLGTGIKSYLKK